MSLRTPVGLMYMYDQTIQRIRTLASPMMAGPSTAHRDKHTTQRCKLQPNGQDVESVSTWSAMRLQRLVRPAKVK